MAYEECGYGKTNIQKCATIAYNNRSFKMVTKIAFESENKDALSESPVHTARKLTVQELKSRISWSFSYTTMLHVS